MMVSIYPFYPVHEMGKFTHFVYGMFWVKILGIFRYVDRLSDWMVGNRQNKKVAPSCYTAGLVTALKALTETG